MTLTEEELHHLEARAAEPRPEHLSAEPSPDAQGEPVLWVNREGLTPAQIEALSAWVDDTFGDDTILEGSRGLLTFLVKT